METTKYITIRDISNDECGNVGTINNLTPTEGLKEAVESHFDAKLVSFSFKHEDVTELTDCINANAIDIIVTLEDESVYSTELELAQTWLY